MSVKTPSLISDKNSRAFVMNMDQALLHQLFRMLRGLDLIKEVGEVIIAVRPADVFSLFVKVICAAVRALAKAVPDIISEPGSEISFVSLDRFQYKADIRVILFVDQAAFFSVKFKYFFHMYLPHLLYPVFPGNRSSDMVSCRFLVRILGKSYLILLVLIWSS